MRKSTLKKTPGPETALHLIRELAHVFYWAGRTYFKKGAERFQGYTYDESLIPTETAGITPSNKARLDELKKELREELKEELREELKEEPEEEPKEESKAEEKDEPEPQGEIGVG